MYFLPAGALAGGLKGRALAALAANLVPVTLGNIVGGGAFVAATYYVIYLRGRAGESPRAELNTAPRAGRDRAQGPKS
jgi:formate/nitrite transporter FocA (FNT family)